MLSGINLALMTAVAALNTLYLLRRRTRILRAQLDSGFTGPESAT